MKKTSLLLSLIITVLCTTLLYADKTIDFTLAPYIGAQKFNAGRNLKSAPEIGVETFYSKSDKTQFGMAFGFIQSFNGQSLVKVKTFELTSYTLIPNTFFDPKTKLYFSSTLGRNSFSQDIHLTFGISLRYVAPTPSNIVTRSDVRKGYDTLVRLGMERDMSYTFKPIDFEKLKQKLDQLKRKKDTTPKPKKPKRVKKVAKKKAPRAPKAIKSAKKTPVVTPAVAPAAPPAPKVAAVIPPDTETGWSYKVIAGAFKNQSNANRLADKLGRDGLATYIWKQDHPSGTIYMVQVFAERTLSEAIKHKTKLIDRGYTDTYIQRVKD